MLSNCTTGGLIWILGKSSLLKGLSNIRNRSPKEVVESSCPEAFKNIKMWCLGIWFSGGFGSMNSMVWEVFSQVDLEQIPLLVLCTSHPTESQSCLKSWGYLDHPMCGSCEHSTDIYVTAANGKNIPLREILEFISWRCNFCLLNLCHSVNFTMYNLTLRLQWLTWVKIR